MRNEELTLAELYPVIREVLESGGEFRFYPRGTSMLPLIRQGRDSVVLTAIKKAPKKHDICLYRRQNGQFVLHRLMKRTKDGAPVFCGDNQLSLEYGVPEENILATVKMLYHGDNPYTFDRFAYRFYVGLHCFMPWRWLRFFPRRAMGSIKRRVKK